MKLLEFSVAEFQSFAEEQTVLLHPHMTLLAGRNNVGKSAVLRALQIPVLPQEGAHTGLKLRYRWLMDAGRVRAAFPQIDAANAEAVKWLLSAGDEVDLVAEFLYTGALSPTEPASLALAEMDLPSLGVKAEGKVGTQLGWTSGPFQETATSVGQVEAIARTAMSEVLYLGPRRIELGRRQLMSRRSLEPDARNLTDVLLHLQLNELSTFAAVRTVMREAFPDIRELSVRTGDDPSASSLMGEPYVYFGDRDVPVALRLCGTGLEQMLALTVGVLTATSPRLFLIDEPQAYLHPHAERSLLALLDAHDEHQYLIASHSHVLLRARPLTQVRLIHLEEGASRVVGDPEDEQLLAELGVSAADLWLSDRLLWVEGPSEEEVLSRVAQALLSQVQIASLAIRRMPEAASRFATKNAAAAEAAYQFCADTSRAVAALPVRMRFLFDADEKRPEFRQRLEEASSGMALFLRVRELENLFLDAELLHKALHNLAEGLDIDPPSAEAVAEALARYLDAHDDAQLFPGGPPDGEPPADVVKGSEVLSRLWWDFLIAQYDKVQDGGALSALALDHNPGLLQPLVDILGDMVEPIDGTRAANASVRT